MLQLNHRSASRTLRLLLLYLALLALVCVPPTLSRYRSEAQGNSSAQVAAFNWDIQIQSAQGNLMQTAMYYTANGIAPGWSDTFTVTIQNTADVTVEYQLSAINTTGNLPLTFTYTNQSATIARGDSATATLTISWPSTENSPEYSQEMDAIELQMLYQQVD